MATVEAEIRRISYQIRPAEAGIRVEQFLSRKSYSRQNLAQLKSCAGTWMNGKSCRLNQRLNAGDTLEIHIPVNERSEGIPAAAIPLSVIYEDEDILVVNKPAGLPVHPSKDNLCYSLANAVMYYYRDRGGIVFRCPNRLDRDTSGLIIIAKHSVSAAVLASMTKKGKTRGEKPTGPGMEREYLAIVCGRPSPGSGTLEAPLSRRKALSARAPFPERSIEYCVDFDHGRHAVTHYRVLETRNGYSLVSILLETGRTHQIRVHMAHLGCPLAGDYLYNPSCRRASVQTYTDWPAAGISKSTDSRKSVKISRITVPTEINGISRQALHACRLRFPHPITGKPMEFTAPLPEDMLSFGFESRQLYPL